ncbi:MAG: alpha/beta fold hydrolase [Gemmatimonadaceae bacterium]|nr:alpha/beta fold hydrolase [Gemmatimonadaceae bacterium]
MRGEFVDLDGQRLYCFAAGTRGAGAPIVLVHGAFTSSHLWREVIPRLPDGHRVLVLDLLGHGRSDLPADAAYDVAAHGARLRTLLDVLGVEPACLVGHGLGAAIVCDVAQRAPERVRHLVLANPCLVASASEPASAPRALRRLARLTPIFRRLPPAWLASTLHTTLLRGYRQRGAGSHVLDVYLKPYRSLAGHVRRAFPPRGSSATPSRAPREVPRQLTPPMQVARRSPSCPASHRRFRKNRPTASRTP